MKLFSAALMASLANYAYAETDPAQALLDRWNMDEPEITYNSTANKFTLDFPTASTSNELSGLQEEFYDVNCKDDGSGFPERVLPAGQVKDPENGGRPQMTLDGPGGHPQLEFVIDVQAMANNQYVYEVVGEADESCFGQQYNVTMNVTIDVSIDVDIYGGDIVWHIEDSDGNVVFDGPDYGAYHPSIPENNPGNVVTEVPDLCRGKDYYFKYTDLFGDGLFNNGSVEGYYMDDLLFSKTGSAIADGFESIFNLPRNPQNPATNLQGREGQGMMKFCVRSSLGYDGDLNQAWSLDQQLDNDYKEVNFIESLITIFFDLSAGFTVLEFNVDPKERVETTAQKDTYELEAWLCNTAIMDTTTFDGDTVDKVVPSAISDNFLASSPEATAEYFNQGALITVCVAPDDAAWIDGIRMNGITKFDWLRDDLSTTAQFLPAGELGPINQKAIEDGEEASNGLTSYIKADCEDGKPYCVFSSILFADFYISRGVVSGAGNANLQFALPGQRRLGAPEQDESAVRKLQDEAAESPFDVSVPVDLTDEGPGALKTAGGASYGMVFTSAVALLSAALLA